jgi:uncharacterized protein (TIGR03435 family)
MVFMAAAFLVTVSALRLDAEPQTRIAPPQRLPPSPAPALIAQAKAKERARATNSVAPASVEFEVTSIHSNAPDVQLANLATEGGEFRAQNVSVRRLIEYAYDLRPFQLSNGPGWINTQRYSIAAKNAASEAEAKLKLQRLLIDRFALRMNRTLAQRRVYALMIANRRRFHPTEQPEEPAHTKLTPAGPQLRANLYAFSMQNVADSLTRTMEQTVVDETGLSGKFDFEFAMEGSSTRGLDLLPALPDLGLKLASRRGPVETYSIESVAPPSEN